VLNYEYSCDRIAKFHKKILFITRVINIQIWTTKYFSFQCSVTYCSQALRRPAHRARKTVHLLTHETPDFISPALWPANSPDLNPVKLTGLRSGLSQLPDLVEAAGSCVPQPRNVDQLTSRLIEEWVHFYQVVIDKAVRQWRPRLGACVRLRAHGGHFEHTL